VIIKRNEEADYKSWVPLQRNKIILNQDHFEDNSRKVSLAGELLHKLLSKAVRPA
jgi:Zn-dependent peptidase ImmA (M78 family)